MPQTTEKALDRNGCTTNECAAYANAQLANSIVA